MTEPTVTLYKGEREVRTYSELHHATRMLIKTSHEHIPGNAYTVMSALILEAFTFEAYLNHLGERHFNLWTEDERIPWRQKFDMIRDKVDLKRIDGTRRPYSTLYQLFWFRNVLAHGRTETFREEFQVAEPPPLAWPKSDWEKYLTHDNAIVGREDVETIIHKLHSMAGLGDHPFDAPGASGEFTLKRTNP